MAGVARAAETTVATWAGGGAPLGGRPRRPCGWRPRGRGPCPRRERGTWPVSTCNNDPRPRKRRHGSVSGASARRPGPRARSARVSAASASPCAASSKRSATRATRAGAAPEDTAPSRLSKASLTRADAFATSIRAAVLNVRIYADFGGVRMGFGPGTSLPDCLSPISDSNPLRRGTMRPVREGAGGILGSDLSLPRRGNMARSPLWRLSDALHVARRT